MLAPGAGEKKKGRGGITEELLHPNLPSSSFSFFLFSLLSQKIPDCFGLAKVKKQKRVKKNKGGEKGTKSKVIILIYFLGNILNLCYIFNLKNNKL